MTYAKPQGSTNTHLYAYTSKTIEQFLSRDEQRVQIGFQLTRPVQVSVGIVTSLLLLSGRQKEIWFLNLSVRRSVYLSVYRYSVVGLGLVEGWVIHHLVGLLFRDAVESYQQVSICGCMR